MVAVELDEQRLEALRDPDRERLESPIRTGLLPWLLALLEKSVGSLTDVFPGSEMLEAVDEAEAVGAKTILIDQPIDLILQEIRGVPLLERLRIGFDVLVAMFAIVTKRNTADLTKTDLDSLLSEFGVKYPTLFRILVEDRDQFMADRLRDILDSTTGTVIAIVGLGHVKGVNENLALNRQTRIAGSSAVRYEWTLIALP